MAIRAVEGSADIISVAIEPKVAVAALMRAPNEPSITGRSLEEIADLKGVDTETLVKAAFETTQTVFGLRGLAAFLC